MKINGVKGYGRRTANGIKLSFDLAADKWSIENRKTGKTYTGKVSGYVNPTDSMFDLDKFTADTAALVGDAGYTKQGGKPAPEYTRLNIRWYANKQLMEVLGS